MYSELIIDDVMIDIGIGKRKDLVFWLSKAAARLHQYVYRSMQP